MLCDTEISRTMFMCLFVANEYFKFFIVWPREQIVTFPENCQVVQ